jgi:hypothetical protein
MRILITKLGDEIIKSIGEENNINTQSKSKNKQQKNFNDTNKSNKSFISNKNKTINNSFSKTKNSKFSNKNKNNNNFDQQNKLTLDDSTVMSSKIIQVKQKKINIPKNITDRYNTNSDNKTNFILPSLTLHKFKDKTSSNFNNTQNNLNTTSYLTKIKMNLVLKMFYPMRLILI